MRRQINGYEYMGSSPGGRGRLPVVAQWRNIYPGGASTEVYVVDGRDEEYRDPYEAIVSAYNAAGGIEVTKAISVEESEDAAIEAAVTYMENNPSGPWNGGDLGG
jgi:hypothetical protein